MNKSCPGREGVRRVIRVAIIGLALLAVSLAGCGKEGVEPARDEAAVRQAVLDDLVETHQALALADEILQFDPLLDCNKTPEDNVPALIAFARDRFGACGQVSATGATVTYDFGAAPGCQYGWIAQVSGVARATIEKSGVNLIIKLDLSGARVNGVALRGLWTLETRDCTVYWARPSASAESGPRAGGLTITGRPGSFTVDGALTTTSTNPVTTSNLSGVTFRPGDCFPSGGEITISLSDALQTIRFDEETVRSGLGVIVPGGERVLLRASGPCLQAMGNCRIGRADCDGNPANACETNIYTDVQSCGACGRICAPPHAYPRCNFGRCQIRDCENFFKDCDKKPENGCEVDARNDPRNCSACGAACSVANGTPKCALGVCAVGQCNAGFGDCDGSYQNGCEARLANDPRNCGACGNACAVRANADAATCLNGQCANVCTGGWADCDGRADNGCETAVRSSPNNCGGCGVVCAVHANAMAATCQGGACGNACNPGFGDCDGQVMNGCETATSGDVRNCGACGAACALANATPACRMGACGIAACSPGFGDCDGLPMNGCELALGADVNNCGACRRACVLANAVPTCRAGACAIQSCRSGFADCDAMVGNGCEQATSGDVNNCGACGRSCTLANAVPACAMGACTVAACNPGFGNCDGQAANGCEVNLGTTVAHCGGCGNVCAPNNAAPACMGGACTIAGCNAGWRDCDGSPGNGCERDVRVDVMNCGACGNVCPQAAMGARCVSSVCVAPTCNDGIRNGLETDVDCGGTCPNKCVDGNACMVDTDCRNGYCRAFTGRCFSGHDLVARWRFDEGMGATAADSSGRNNHGTLEPAPAMMFPWDLRIGVSAPPSLQFDRTNDVKVNGSASLDGLGSHMTLSAWVRPKTLAVYDTVLMKTSNDGWGNGYGIASIHGTDLCGFTGGWGWSVCAPFTPDTNWHHVAMTFDGTTLRIYIDNVATSAQLGMWVPFPSADPLYIGWGLQNPHGFAFDGNIDEVRIYDGALTPQEIGTLFNTPNGNGP